MYWSNDLTSKELDEYRELLNCGTNTETLLETAKADAIKEFSLKDGGCAFVVNGKDYLYDYDGGDLFATLYYAAGNEDKFAYNLGFTASKPAENDVEKRLDKLKSLALEERLEKEKDHALQDLLVGQSGVVPSDCFLVDLPEYGPRAFLSEDQFASWYQNFFGEKPEHIKGETAILAAIDQEISIFKTTSNSFVEIFADGSFLALSHEQQKEFGALQEKAESLLADDLNNWAESCAAQKFSPLGETALLFNPKTSEIYQDFQPVNLHGPSEDYVILSTFVPKDGPLSDEDRNKIKSSVTTVATANLTSHLLSTERENKLNQPKPDTRQEQRGFSR